MSASAQDHVAQQAIYFAKYMHAKTPREAAEMTAGQALTDQQWQDCCEVWERNWPLVPNPNSIVERIKRTIGFNKYA